MNVGIGYLHVFILNAVVRDGSELNFGPRSEGRFPDYIEVRSIDRLLIGSASTWF
jgi:hypothetical protein